MTSRCFVVDEWVIHDLSGDNCAEAQDQSLDFIKKLKEKCDRIAVLNDSPWMRKAYDLMTRNDPLLRQISRYLHLSILRDLRKCQIIDASQIEELPSSLKKLVPEKDHYLVATCRFAKAEALVTTDNALFDSLSSSHAGIAVKMRNDFLKNYLS